MSARILIFGGSGMLGKPVTDEFIRRGHTVTVVSTNIEKTKTLFAGKAEVVAGDITDRESLIGLFKDIDWVYLNLNSKLMPELYQKIEIDGTAAVAQLAAENNIKRIGLISGSSSNGVETGEIYRDAKVKAERAVMACGVPYHIFRPSWFYESLPHFIQQERAVVLGKQPLKIGWLASEDYAKQVVNAYESDNAVDKAFYNLGPEKFTMMEALELYCEYKEPNLKPGVVSFMQAKMVSMMPGMEKLKLAIPFFEYFSKNSEDVDTTETDHLLGANKTTLRDWLKK